MKAYDKHLQRAASWRKHLMEEYDYDPLEDMFGDS